MLYFPFFLTMETTNHKTQNIRVGHQWSELWKKSPHSIPLTHIFETFLWISNDFKRL